MKYALSKLLVLYYPLAGRLRTSPDHDQKLEVDCNGEGAVFAEAFMDITADQFLQLSEKPNRSWKKLLYKVEGALTFLDVPPLVVQVLLLDEYLHLSLISDLIYSSFSLILSKLVIFVLTVISLLKTFLIHTQRKNKKRWHFQSSNSF